MKLKLSQYEFFYRALTHLGHHISEKGIETYIHKMQEIRDRPVPSTVIQVGSFLGFVNYFYHVIHGYAQVTWPLYKRIMGDKASKKNKMVEWDGECDESFSKQKEICTSTPFLVYADFKKLFKLHMDACVLGLGTILYQNKKTLIR